MGSAYREIVRPRNRHPETKFKWRVKKRVERKGICSIDKRLTYFGFGNNLMEMVVSFLHEAEIRFVARQPSLHVAIPVVFDAIVRPSI